MIILDPSDTLQTVLAGAITTSQAVMYAAYVDITTTAFSPENTSALTNSTTPVALISSPAASTRRQVKYLSLYNADSAPITATLSVVDNATVRTIIRVTLQVGERLEYVDSDGFKVFDAVGAIKQSFSQSDSGWVAPTLLNGWANFGAGYAPAGYRKIGSVIYLRGLVSGGTATDGTSIFVIGAGFRTPFILAFPITNPNSPTSDTRIEINSSGAVVVFGGVSNSYLSLDGITYTVD